MRALRTPSQSGRHRLSSKPCSRRHNQTPAEGAARLKSGRVLQRTDSETSCEPPLGPERPQDHGLPLSTLTDTTEGGRKEGVSPDTLVV